MLGRLGEVQSVQVSTVKDTEVIHAPKLNFFYKSQKKSSLWELDEFEIDAKRD